jgi:hypothetical protein
MMAALGGFLGPFVAGYLLTAGYSMVKTTGILSSCVVVAAILIPRVKLAEGKSRMGG